MKFFNDLIIYGIHKNVWLCVHLFIAVFIAKYSNSLWLHNTSDTVALVMFIAVTWEVIEFHGIRKDESNDGWGSYGSSTVWFFDTLCDVVGAVLIAWLVVV